MNFLFNKLSWKTIITVSTKILNSTTVLNIDNNKKLFLSTMAYHYGINYIFVILQ